MSSVNPFPEIFKKKAEKAIKRQMQEAEPLPQEAILEDELKKVEKQPVKRKVEYDTGFSDGIQSIKIDAYLTANEFMLFKRFIRDFKLMFENKSATAVAPALESLLKMFQSNIKNMSNEFIDAIYRFVSAVNAKTGVDFKGINQPIWFKDNVNKSGMSGVQAGRILLLMDSIQNLLSDNLKKPGQVYEDDEIAVPETGQPAFTGTGKKKYKLCGGLKKRVVDLLKELLND
jgi:hypothetical protein